MPEDLGRAGGAYPADMHGTMALIERSIALLLVAGLLAGVLVVLWPFTTAILFGATLAIAAWPLRQAMIRRGLGEGLTATLLLLLSILIVALPVLIMAPALLKQVGPGMQRVQAYFAAAPQRPGWMAGVPLLGHSLGHAWDKLVQAGNDLGAALAPYSDTVRQMLLGMVRSLADSVVQILLSLVLATMFWLNGDAIAQVLQEVFQRLGGPAGAQALDAAGGAVRSVAYGVVGTAVVQAVLLAIGLALAGVPGTMVLGFMALLLALSQVGAPLLVLIWGGAAWWLIGQGHQGWGVFAIGWGLFVSTLDSFLKPWLIGFGVRMPLSLTILGVFGGFIGFGFLGMFIGPTLIAVAFTLLQAWRAASLRAEAAELR